jgi:hypothetical protein
MYAEGMGSGREKGGVKEVFEGLSFSEDDGGDGEERGGWEELQYSWQLEREREEERRREQEWRAVWKYVERRAEVEGGRS